MWPLLLDPEMKLYQAYRFPRGRWWPVYGPISIWKYIRLIAGGTPPGTPGKDWRQLGGNVLIDPEGIVRRHDISQDPHDRPSVDQICQSIA